MDLGMIRSVLLACPKCDMATAEPASYVKNPEDREIICEGCGTRNSLAAMVGHGGTIRRKRGGRSLLTTALRQSQERRQLATMVKAPRFDEPRTRGICGPMLADPYTFPVESGTRLTVVYMGKEILIQILKVIRPDDVFAGKVLEIDQAFAPLGDLIVGNVVAFNRRNIHWIDVPERSRLSCHAYQRSRQSVQGLGSRA
jgi:hypothetical protein